jgi:tetratricopeptide (TPR) repeat protein
VRRLVPLLAACALAGCVSYQDMRARNAYLKGDLDTAEALTESSLASDPKDLEARKLGAKIAIRHGADAMEKGDMNKAQEYFQKAVELNPADETAQKYRDFVERDLRNRIAD